MTKKKPFPPDVATLYASNQLLLNLIFHGPFLFIYYQDYLSYPGRVEVITPHTPEHVTVAGSWLNEKPCHLGTFFLTGVSKQKDPIDPNDPVDDTRHVVINAEDIKINIDGSSFYRFVLPLPSDAESLAVAQLGSNEIFIGDYAGNINATSFGTAHLLSYLIEATDIPQLEDLQWRPETNPYGTVKGHSIVQYNYAKNVHIYAEAPYAPDPFHPVRDFKQMVNMLPGLSLGLVQQFPNLEFEDPKNNDDFGIIREEQGGLRGLPPPHPPLRPPLVCDAPSMVVAGAQDPVP